VGARRPARLAERNGVVTTIEVVAIALAEREADVTLYTADESTAYSTLEPERSPMRNVAAFHPATVVLADTWITGWPRVRALRRGCTASRST
jgi:hypothetical protein